MTGAASTYRGRAARYDGFFPVNLEHPDQLAEIVARLGVLREEAGRNPDEPYDVIASVEGSSPPGKMASTKRSPAPVSSTALMLVSASMTLLRVTEMLLNARPKGWFMM